MVEELRSSRRRAIRNVLIDAMILALALGLLALVRLPGSSVRPLPGQAPAERPSPSPQGVAPILTLTPIRLRGEVGHIGAYRGPTGDLCVELTTEGTISCDLAPRPGDALRLAYANWLYLDSPQYGLGVFVAGAVGPRVASVHVSVGAGRWAEATLLKPPPELGFPFRLFYI